MDDKQINDILKDKTILVTGGTGSFGNAVIKKLLNLGPKKIVVFSRDEKKQFDMGNAYPNHALRYIIGDVRDERRVFDAMRGVDYVFHAAALKQVPHCEFFPTEALETNAKGAHNIIRGAIHHRVKRIVVLSTDKAVYPINVMGMTKALMERIMIAASREDTGGTVLCGTRYGNVMCTRGSVIPHFIEQIKNKKTLTVTDQRMTRFMASLDDALDLVLYALAHGSQGDLYIKKTPSAAVYDVARMLAEIFGTNSEIKQIGIRPGEKLHETLISQEELLRSEDKGDYYRISPEVPQMDQSQYYVNRDQYKSSLTDSYTSENAERLDDEGLRSLLLSVPYIQNELHAWKRQIG